MPTTPRLLYCFEHYPEMTFCTINLTKYVTIHFIIHVQNLITPLIYGIRTTEIYACAFTFNCHGLPTIQRPKHIITDSFLLR